MTRLIDIARSAGVSEATGSLVCSTAKPASTRPHAERSWRPRGSWVVSWARVRSRRAPWSACSSRTSTTRCSPGWSGSRLSCSSAGVGSGACGPAPWTGAPGSSQCFLHSGVDAIIVVSGHHAQQRGPIEHYREITAAGTPLVLINGVRDDLDAASSSSWDDEHAMRLTLTHLQDLGHRRIGLAMVMSTWPVRSKLGVFEEVATSSLEGEWPVSFTDFSYAGGNQAALDLIAHDVTAIVCGSDVMAAWVLEGVRSHGLSVPEDISVVGYDDVFSAGLTDPPLTTVRQAVNSIARAAVRAALGGGEESRRPARTEVVVRPQLIVARSTAAAPEGSAG